MVRSLLFRKRHEAEEITPIPGPLESNASGVDHLQHLQQFEKAHKLDPNLPIDELNDVDAAIATGNAEKGIEIEHALMEDNSPYPEVVTLLSPTAEASVACMNPRGSLAALFAGHARWLCLSSNLV